MSHDSLLMILSIANQKGGCGKTTTAINLSTYLALKNKRTLLIDLDPQAAATMGFGFNAKEFDRTIYDAMVEDIPISDVALKTNIDGLDLVPSNSDLSGAEVELANEIGREYILKDKLNALNGYDYVVVDTPPSLGLLTINSLVACSLLLIPLQCEFYALAGTSLLLDVLDKVKTRLNNDPKIRIVLTMYDARTNLSKQVADNVREIFPGEVFQTIIPRNVKLAEAPSFGQPIYLYDPYSVGADAYKKLVDEVLHG